LELVLLSDNNDNNNNNNQHGTHPKASATDESSTEHSPIKATTIATSPNRWVQGLKVAFDKLIVEDPQQNIHSPRKSSIKKEGFFDKKNRQ
jgi:hypothetical protein